MAKKTTVVFRTKLGAAKKQSRSRIWLEGQRLVDAGFMVGSYFVKELSPKPELHLILLKEDDVLATALCKVSGKGNRPIIDITGEQVRSVFGSLGTHVDVEFKKGHIVIRPASDA